jgi:hypothetical protein
MTDYGQYPVDPKTQREWWLDYVGPWCSPWDNICI